MKELCLVIYDEDYIYIEEFIKFFNKNYNGHFKVLGVTSKKDLERMVLSRRTIDVFLVNKELMRNTEEINMMKLTIALSESDVTNDIDNRIIFKYQNGNALYSCIKKIYSSINKENTFDRSTMDTKIVTFFSPIGGVGKTTLSLLYAIRLTREGCKVLFISLEQISSLGIYFDINDKDNSLADLFYKVSDGLEIDNGTLERIIKKDLNTNVYYINPVNSTLDFEEIDPNGLINILDTIKKITNFDYIIIDTGSRLDTSTTRLQEYSNRAIGVIENNNISLVKMSKMYNEFLNDENTIILVNKYKINNETSINDEFVNIKKKIYAYVPYDNLIDQHNLSCKKLQDADSINTRVSELVHKLLREE